MTIPTYFSHSYRLDDQALNKTFWRLFADAGFSFFVDPPSDTTSHTHLERMMGRCSAFVAVVNRREDVGRFRCSRFILYEYGLSIQARRPRLLLIDRRVPNAPFRSLPPNEAHLFSHNDALSGEAELRSKIANLHSLAEPLSHRHDRQRAPIALLVPPNRERSAYASRRVAARIKKAAEPAGFEIVECAIPYEHNAFFALDLDQYEAVILDVRGSDLPPWVFAYVYGRLIPTIKLVQVMPRETPDSVELPPLIQGLRMDEAEPGVESVIYWRDEDDLIWQLANGFRKLDEEETVFKKDSEGELYFDSINRRPARVFISNASHANPLARRLSEELRRRNIERFHYKEPSTERDAIATGSPWAQKIEQEVAGCDIFIALIGEGYDKSKWCKREMEIALGRKENPPVLLLYNADGTKLESLLTARKLGALKETQISRLPDDTQAAVTHLLTELQGRLTHDALGQNMTPHRTTLLGASHELVIDAVRHVPRTAWPKLIAAMRDLGAEPQLPRSDSGPVRTRAVAEGLFIAAQRRDTTQSGAVLQTLVKTLARLGPPKYRAALTKVLRSAVVQG